MKVAGQIINKGGDGYDVIKASVQQSGSRYEVKTNIFVIILRGRG